MEKLIVICGPTCTGKTSLAIKLCQKFNGEIVSADSRQIYKFMDIGTGKLSLSQVQSSKFKVQKGDGYWIVDGVYIHLYDVVEPDRNFSVARFKDAATKEIESMWRRGRMPFLVGGTGFYIAAVLGETEFPRIPPDWRLRQELERLSTTELFAKLQKLNPEKAKTIDPKNPHRLIRAIEVVLDAPSGSRELHSRNPCAIVMNQGANLNVPLADPSVANTLKVGLTADREILYQRADAWAESIVNDGLLNEVQDLINRGYKNTPPMKGIIYQTAVEHLDGKVDKEEMLQRIKFDLHGYIRRQLTWFRKDKDIHWFDIAKTDFDLEVEEVVESYLDKNSKS